MADPRSKSIMPVSTTSRQTTPAPASGPRKFMPPSGAAPRQGLPGKLPGKSGSAPGIVKKGANLPPGLAKKVRPNPLPPVGAGGGGPRADKGAPVFNPPTGPNPRSTSRFNVKPGQPIAERGSGPQALSNPGAPRRSARATAVLQGLKNKVGTRRQRVRPGRAMKGKGGLSGGSLKG